MPRICNYCKHLAKWIHNEKIGSKLQVVHTHERINIHPQCMLKSVENVTMFTRDALHIGNTFSCFAHEIPHHYSLFFCYIHLWYSKIVDIATKILLINRMDNYTNHLFIRGDLCACWSIQTATYVQTCYCYCHYCYCYHYRYGYGYGYCYNYYCHYCYFYYYCYQYVIITIISSLSSFSSSIIAIIYINEYPFNISSCNSVKRSSKLQTSCHKTTNIWGNYHGTCSPDA